MTMLDRMRRHKGWLKWSLFLVVLAFVVFYIPDFLQQTDGAAPGEVVARVGDQEITASTFRRAYQMQIAAYQRAYGGNFNEQMLRQLGIEQQILQQLLDEHAAVAEAERLGLKVTDQELAQRIMAIPAFQQDGQFAGHQVYERVLAMQRPPLTTAEFEENLRRSLLAEKLRAAVTEWVAVSDAEVERAYRDRNEKVKLEFVVFSADRFRDQVTVTDADLSATFEKNKETYRVGEKRRIKYFVVDVENIRKRIVVPPGDVERHYQQNIELYTTPEQVRASHILLKTEGKDEAAVKARAEQLLKQARAGADFAALAKANSEDGSAAQGGDLDYFGRGRMVPEFDEVAFKLAPGSISDLVKTQFGYHIIKVTDKKPETKRTLDEVRQQIADQLAYERAQQEANDLAAKLDAEIDEPADLERVAKSRGLEVKESGFFTKEEPIAGLGPVPQLAEQAFTMKDGEVAGPVRVARGNVFFTVTGRQESKVPALAEVKDRVREDTIRQKARELAKTRAESLAAAFKSDFAGAAKKAGLDVKTTELIARGSPLPEVGVSTAVDAAVFGLQQGGVSGPIATDAGTVVARVAERDEIEAAELAAQRDALREELVAEQRGRFFGAYMQKAKERLTTQINQETLRRVVGA